LEKRLKAMGLDGMGLVGRMGGSGGEQGLGLERARQGMRDFVG
jgi:hypothetical protein